MRVAWLVVLAVTACGDDRRYAVDAGTPDASTGLVTVRYSSRDGFPGGGLAVYFQNPDSTLVLATRTLDDGTANAFLPSGGFVTVRTSQSELWTWGGVKPGDELVLGAPPSVGEDHILELTVPADPAASTYWLHTSCGEVGDVTGAQQQPRMISVRTCGTDAVDLLLVSRLANFQTLSSYMVRPEVVIAGTARLTFDAALVPAAPSTITLTDVPVRFGFFYATQQLLGRDGGTLFDSASFGTAVLEDVGGQGMTTVPIPRPADVTLVTYVDDTNTSGGNTLLHLVDWGPAGNEVVIPIEDRIIRPFVGEPIFEAESSSLIWFEADQGLIPDAAKADLLFGDGRLRWHVLGPRATPELIARGALRLPVLPDPELRLVPGEPVRTLGLSSILGTGGYDVYRASLLGWQPGDRWPIVGSAGHAQWSELAPERP